jgi:hypothetical protein
MPSENDKKDIEIIPPDSPRRRGPNEGRIYISIDGEARSFNELPLHKRILLGTAGIAGALILGTLVFLIIASAVLIWIPLLAAAAIVSAIVLYVRSRFLRR